MEIQKNIALHDKNTFRIGGRSAFYVEPKSEAELKESFNWAVEKEVPVFILGKGSNVLISDAGWSGLTINTSAGMNTVVWDGERATAQCGVLLNTLINESIFRGYGGMEGLSGIPGTVGGAVIMNAGAFNSCIADTFKEAFTCDLSSGETSITDASGAAFGYRSSAFKDSGAFIMSATFSFNRSANADEMKVLQREILNRRKSKQPLDYPNCGSVFKRLPGNFAGTLIESCGCKGLQSGDMQISEKHANFIINKGNGQARDVRILIRTVQKRVFEKCGIHLEPEVLFIGDFDEPLFN